VNKVNHDLAHRWFDEVWNQRKRETIYSLVDPSCTGHHEGEVTKGPADIEAMWGRLLSLLPDLTVHIEDILTDGDDAVVRWRFAGTHGGAAGSKPAMPREVSFSGITWLKIRDGRIVEGWDSWNQAALLQKLQGSA